MSSLFIFLFIVFLIKKLKSDARGSDFGKLLGTLLVLGMLFGGIGPVIGIGAALAAVFGVISALALPVGIIAFLLYKYVIKQEAEERSQKYGWDDRTREKMKEREVVRERARKEERKASASSGTLTSKILPKPVGRRKKLISAFNTKYTLYLTDEQIKRIADASYFSLAWKEEVEAMAPKYDAVYQWFQGSTAYLRAYLYVFPVQDVTSDFAQQQQICIDSFEEVFAYADSFPELNIDGKIQKINSKFFTNFDEVTYMIAFRFLEQNGYHHKLDRVELNKNDADIDDLLLKYQRQEREEQGVPGV